MPTKIQQIERIAEEKPNILLDTVVVFIFNMIWALSPIFKCDIEVHPEQKFQKKEYIYKQKHQFEISIVRIEPSIDDNRYRLNLMKKCFKPNQILSIYPLLFYNSYSWGIKDEIWRIHKRVRPIKTFLRTQYNIDFEVDLKYLGQLFWLAAVGLPINILVVLNALHLALCTLICWAQPEAAPVVVDGNWEWIAGTNEHLLQRVKYRIHTHEPGRLDRKQCILLEKLYLFFGDVIQDVIALLELAAV